MIKVSLSNHHPLTSILSPGGERRSLGLFSDFIPKGEQDLLGSVILLFCLHVTV